MSGLEKTGIGAMIIGSLALLVFSPVLTFVFAYIGGVILDWIVGGRLVIGLNLMFDTTRFTREMIPLACATLATIGKYFKASQTNNNNK